MRAPGRSAANARCLANRHGVPPCCAHKFQLTAPSDRGRRPWPPVVPSCATSCRMVFTSRSRHWLCIVANHIYATPATSPPTARNAASVTSASALSSTSLRSEGQVNQAYQRILGIEIVELACDINADVLGTHAHPTGPPCTPLRQRIAPPSREHRSPRPVHTLQPTASPWSPCSCPARNPPKPVSRTLRPVRQ